MLDEKQDVSDQEREHKKVHKMKLNKKIVYGLGVPALILNTINLYLYGFEGYEKLNNIILSVVATIACVLFAYVTYVISYNYNIIDKKIEFPKLS